MPIRTQTVPWLPRCVSEKGKKIWKKKKKPTQPSSRQSSEASKWWHRSWRSHKTPASVVCEEWPFPTEGNEERGDTGGFKGGSGKVNLFILACRGQAWGFGFWVFFVIFCLFVCLVWEGLGVFFCWEGRFFCFRRWKIQQMRKTSKSSIWTKKAVLNMELALCTIQITPAQSLLCGKAKMGYKFTPKK